MEHEKIVTMYDTLAQAEGAKRSLIKAGFHEHDVDVIHGDKLKEEGHEARHPGLWQRLFGSSLDEEQSDVYEEAIRSGGSVLTLRAKEDDLPRAYSILDAHDTTGLVTPSSSDYLLSGSDNTAPDTVSTNNSPDLSVTNSEPPVRTALTGDETEEEILRLAEERLEVGKRLVSEGTTRVRRYTVTDEVSQSISLHEQHADIFRREAAHQAPSDNVDWEEKTIEIEETHERPVINKTTHITEEVVVRTDESDRVENITDSVRRQEVDIEHAGYDAEKAFGSPKQTDSVTASRPAGAAEKEPRLAADEHALGDRPGVIPPTNTKSN